MKPVITRVVAGAVADDRLGQFDEVRNGVGSDVRSEFDRHFAFGSGDDSHVVGVVAHGDWGRVGVGGTIWLLVFGASGDRNSATAPVVVPGLTALVAFAADSGAASIRSDRWQAVR
jgi:precorrin-3B methylase